MRSPLHQPTPKDVGITGVDSEREGNDHFEVEQFDPTAVFVTVETTHPALVKNAAFQYGRDIAHDLRHETPEQIGNLVFAHPNASCHWADYYPPLVYHNMRFYRYHSSKY
jgi:hypothetical protein